MVLYVQFPSWVRMEIIPSLPFRWYGLMYVFAFAVTYGLTLLQVKKGEASLSRDDVDDLFLRCILCLLLGARLFSQLVYEGTWYYWLHPWLIFWPFRNGHFTGLAGMSYHGGVIGAILGAVWFSKKRHKNFFTCADALCAGIPLGYTFGRLGNFINGELYGRVCTKSWGMVFPEAPGFSTNYQWVRNVAEKIGMAYQHGQYLNLPRHPSQLYEAFFEGIVLFLFLWFFIRPRKGRHPSGFVFGWYLIGYGAIRFVLEYFRAPDENLGYIIKGGAGSDNIALFQSFRNISLGQILCFLMMVGGVMLLVVRKKESGKHDD